MRDHEYWIRIAEEDKTAIEHFRACNGPWRIVVFLASSAAEKYLKGYLAFQDCDPERAHDMNKLLVEARAFDPSLSEFVTDCGHLSLFSSIRDTQNTKPIMTRTQHCSPSRHRNEFATPFENVFTEKE